MRLVSYNILDGGEGRADPLAEIIEAQRPDIVVLAEADHPDVLNRIARRLKMDFVHAGGNETSSVAILSRWAIRESINHTPMRPKLSKALLEAVIVEPSGQSWTIGALHLHARAAESDEQRREEELAEILDVFSSHRKDGRPHLLAGDFNANSPTQNIDINQVRPSTRKSMEDNGAVLPRRVVQRLLDAGYVDTLHAHDPRLADTTGTFCTQHPGQRVDYIFAHAIHPSRIKAAWIEQDRLARYASDHFPAAVEIGD